MTKVSTDTICDKAIEIVELYQIGKMQKAIALALEAENEASLMEDEAERATAQ